MAVRSGLLATASETVSARRCRQANQAPPPAAACQRSDDSPGNQTRPASASPNTPTSPTESRPAKSRSSALAYAPERPANRCSARSEEHTSELQSPCNLVCRLLLEKKKNEH